MKGPAHSNPRGGQRRLRETVHVRDAGLARRAYQEELGARDGELAQAQARLLPRPCCRAPTVLLRLRQRRWLCRELSPGALHSLFAGAFELRCLPLERVACCLAPLASRKVALVKGFMVGEIQAIGRWAAEFAEHGLRWGSWSGGYRLSMLARNAPCVA